MSLIRTRDEKWVFAFDLKTIGHSVICLDKRKYFPITEPSVPGISSQNHAGDLLRLDDTHTSHLTQEHMIILVLKRIDIILKRIQCINRLIELLVSYTLQ